MTAASASADGAGWPGGLGLVGLHGAAHPCCAHFFLTRSGGVDHRLL